MNGGEAEGLVRHEHHEHELGRNLLAIGMLRTLSNVIPLSPTEVCTKVDRISHVVNMELRLEQIIRNQDHVILDNPCLHVIVPGILQNESLHVVDMCGELG